MRSSAGLIRRALGALAITVVLAGAGAGCNKDTGTTTELKPAAVSSTTSTRAAPTTTAAPTTSTTAAPAPAAAQARSTTSTTARTLSNNNTYVNSDGNTVHSPAYSSDGQPPAGATAQCKDGTYSSSQHRQGTCSGHGGVSRWL
ncbi:MAG TPA: DUF3761 domain-containing protein [Acidimicrobiales bacterium]|nr:DUF3761 domain-containing protein [Acidimicrobiales bacterium]